MSRFGIQTLGSTQEDGIGVVGGSGFRNGGGKLSWLSLGGLYFPYQQVLSHLLGGEGEVTCVGGRHGGRESRGHVRELLWGMEENVLQGSQLGLG